MRAPLLSLLQHQSQCLCQLISQQLLPIVQPRSNHKHSLPPLAMAGADINFAVKDPATMPPAEKPAADRASSAATTARPPTTTPPTTALAIREVLSALKIQRLEVFTIHTLLKLRWSISSMTVGKQLLNLLLYELKNTNLILFHILSIHLFPFILFKLGQSRIYSLYFLLWNHFYFLSPPPSSQFLFIICLDKDGFIQSCI